MKSRSIRIFFSLTIFAITAIASVKAPAQEVRPGEHRSTGEMDRDIKIAQELREKMIRSEKLDVSSELLREFATTEINASNSHVWSDLLKEMSVDGKRDATAADFERASVLSDTVSAYIRLKKSGLVDNLHFSEVDLLAQNRGWTADQSKGFAKTIRRAAIVAESSGVVTMNDAIDQSLDEEGLLQKARAAGCKF